MLGLTPNGSLPIRPSVLSAGKRRREYGSGTISGGKSLAVLLLILCSSNAFLHNYADGFLLASTIFAAACWALSTPVLRPSYVMFLAGVGAWLVLISVRYEVFNAYTLAGFYVRLILPYFVVMMLAGSYLDVFNRWVVRLTALSLAAFALSLLIPSLFIELTLRAGPLFVFKGDTVLSGVSVGGWRRLALGFFTFAPDMRFRNHGFMWEPGAFGVILNITLALQLIRGDLRFSWSKIILIFGILTTFSTTGYVALFINSAYWLTRKRGLGIIVAVALMVVAGIASASVSFLLPKIIAELQLGADYAQRGVNWTLTRYASFVLDGRDFVEHPILGRGIYIENRYTGNLILPSNNGLSDLAVRYGLIGVIVILWKLAQSVWKVAGGNVFSVLIFLTVIIIGGWSERFFELPFFVALLFLNYQSFGHRPDLQPTLRGAPRLKR